MSIVLRSSNHEINWDSLPKVRFSNKGFINENFLEAIESDLASQWFRQDRTEVNKAWRSLQHIYNKVKSQLRPGMHEPGELDPKLILPVLEVLGFHQRKKKFTPPNADEMIEPDHHLEEISRLKEITTKQIKTTSFENLGVVAEEEEDTQLAS